MWPPTRQDLFRYGLPAAACVPDARALDSITVSGPVFECRGHGFSGGEIVRFVARPGSTLPAGIVSPLTWYTVNPPTDSDMFTVAGLVLSDAGAGTINVVEDIGPKLDDLMARRASWLVSWYKAGQGPWTTPPQWAAMVVAKLAAFDVAQILRTPSSRFSIDDVRKAHDDAQAFLERLDKGEPYNDGVGPVDATPLVPEMGAVLVHLDGRDFLECRDNRA